MPLENPEFLKMDLGQSFFRGVRNSNVWFMVLQAVPDVDWWAEEGETGLKIVINRVVLKVIGEKWRV